MTAKSNNGSQLATPASTAAHRDEQLSRGCQSGSYRRLGKTDLQVSLVGFGGYRIDSSVDEHSDALQHALDSGCNLIDTSTNYGDGASERLIGRILAGTDGRLERSNFVIVSKVGYLQGTNLSQIREKMEKGRAYPELVEYQENCWHCIHPNFIRDQIQESKYRLAVEGIDVMLLHNPEYFFSDCEARADPRPIEERRDAFYKRIEMAFECLEELVLDGVIGHYGVSSNSFVKAADDPIFTSLSRMLRIAQRVGTDGHHFSVVQFPMNLFESQAAFEKNNGDNHDKTVLEVAREADLGVLVNRPLNAIRRGQLLRLSDHDCAPTEKPLKRLQAEAQALEKEFVEGLSQTFESGGVSSTELFCFSGPLGSVAEKINDAIQWDGYVTQVFSPEISRRVSHVDEILSGPLQAAWHLWLERYVDAMSDLADAYRVRCARMSQRRSDKIHDLLKAHIPKSMQEASLSQKALLSVLGTPGVTVALVGMRETEYVQDVLTLMYDPFEPIQGSVLRAMEKFK
jgi:aryl-alcohol dehydrogenase-like predicted oxidoreductase